MMSELTELYGEPIKEIRGTNTDVAKIIVGEEPPYQSIQVSGELLTVERGPSYTEQTSLKKTNSFEEEQIRKTVKTVIADLEDDNTAGARINDVIDRCVERGAKREFVVDEIEKLRTQGDIYEPTTDFLRTV